MSSLPERFNWVKARAECSIAKMFSMLETDVKSDVEVRNELSKQSPDGRSFEFHDSDRAFMVLRYIVGMPKPMKVDFVLKDDSIEVSGHGAEFSVGVWLNSNGSCVYSTLGSQNLESWRVRRMALNALFFGDLNEPPQLD
jgi:hypothetical protein